MAGKKCLSCGNPINPHQNRCSFCGREPPVAGPPPGWGYKGVKMRGVNECPWCGKTLKKDMESCPSCGYRIPAYVSSLVWNPDGEYYEGRPLQECPRCRQVSLFWNFRLGTWECL